MHKGFIIKCFRLQCNFTQEYVAQSLDMSQANYCKKENCLTKFSNEECETIAKLFKIPSSYILNSENELVLIPKTEIEETNFKKKIEELEKRIKELETKDEINQMIILNLSKKLT